MIDDTDPNCSDLAGFLCSTCKYLMERPENRPPDWCDNCGIKLTEHTFGGEVENSGDLNKIRKETPLAEMLLIQRRRQRKVKH